MTVTPDIASESGVGESGVGDPAHIGLAPPAPASAARSRPARGFAFLVGGQSAAKLARFIGAVLLARALQVSSYGLVNVGIAVSGLTVMAATLGMTELGVRDVAVEGHRSRWIAGRVLAARLIGIMLVTAVLALAAVLANPSILPALGMVTLMSLAMGASGDWLLRGKERMGSLAVAEATGGFVVMVGCLLLAFTHATPVLALGIFAAGEAAATSVCWIGAGRASLPSVGLDGVKAMLRRSWPIGLSSIAFYAYYANIDTIILAATRSAREAGLYTAAYRLFLAANLVVIVAAYVQLPILSREVAAGDDSAAATSLRRALYFLGCYGATVVGVAEAAGHGILHVLFGARFTSMTPVLVMLCMGLTWYAVGFPAGYTLIARGHSKRLLAGSATAAILNLSLNALLIPLTGAIGAAIATFVAFLCASVVWLQAHAILERSALRIYAMLTAATVAGFAALALPVARLPIGIGTIAIALIAAGDGARRLLMGQEPATFGAVPTASR